MCAGPWENLPDREHSYGRPQAAVGLGVRLSARDRTLGLGARCWCYPKLPRSRTVGALQIPPEIQAVFQQLQGELIPLAQQAVREALEAQAPVAGIDVNFRGGKWIQRDATDGDASAA